MALAFSHFEITLALADKGGNVSHKTFVCNPANVPDYTGADTARTWLHTNYPNLTNGVVISSRLQEVFQETAISLAAATENENKALISVQLNGRVEKSNLEIPQAKDALFLGSSGAAYNQVDITNTALLAFVSQYHTTGYFFISDGESVALNPNGGILSGKRIHSKNSNG